jgi:hypothetical protein
MKIFLSVELYEDMIGQPFEISDYLTCRMSLFVQQNGEKKKFVILPSPKQVIKSTGIYFC